MVLARRDRLMTFRLNDTEYEEVVRAMTRTGKRSLSEITRDAVLQYARQNNHPTFGSNLTDVANKLETLREALKQFSASIENVMGPARPTALEEYKASQRPLPPLCLPEGEYVSVPDENLDAKREYERLGYHEAILKRLGQ